jgi:glycosyltransferase involved in cell wall biosynthesis
MWRQFGEAKGLHFVGISSSSMNGAPKELKPLILPPVLHGIEVDDFPFRKNKDDHFITLSRFSRDKGQHIAVQICQELGYKLEMAGIVAGITSPAQLVLELANPLSNYRSNGDFQYYSNYIWPATVSNRNIRYVGNLKGRRKLNFFGQAKAFLFPIDWEEPFGMVLIEALACGTPVVAMKRGSTPEIIEHGVNGFLASSVAEFKKYMLLVDEINPAACRESVEKRFSVPIMAKAYLDRYQSIL